MDDNRFEEQLNNEELNEPIDGQIGIEELFVREEPCEEEEVDLTPADNQISFYDIEEKAKPENKTENKTKTEIENKASIESKVSVDNKNLQENFTWKEVQETQEETKYKIQEENQELELEENQEVNLEESQEEKIEEEQDRTKLDDFFKEEPKTEQDDKILKDFFGQEPDSESEELLVQKNYNDDENTKESFVEEEDRQALDDFFKVEEKVESDKNNDEQIGEKMEEEKKEKKTVKQVKENLFENEENSKAIKDIDELNKNFKDVEFAGGKDVFADYSSDMSTETVQEKEVVDIREKVYNENSGNDVVDGMLYKNLDTVLHESMIPYSEHVILDRALPRVEDGLKPVQRRILYSMMELGVTPDKPFRKSARIVGDCLGKYHPHGDKSVYDAMVRMAQPFNTNVLLVSGHGNFGSVDGDGAAAMRYTEARLAPLAMELLRDLDKNTVKWGLNFDDTLKEPEILPGRFPNLLVNGSTGIAVGLATNIPPHNLAEVIDGVVAYINNPKITLKEMMKIIKGPDFPTGGIILNSSEIKQAYETGKGKVYIRAKMHIESNNNDKKYIVITELPYQVNKSSLLQKIAGFREENKYNLGDISEIRDESDREGLRAVIRLKKDANVKVIYESLLKNTELQTTFGINMVAIAGGKPKQMSLLDIISYYTEYQREIILRRSKYELEQAKEREHILSGLIIAIKNIDAVVKIIKTSQNTTEAKKRLREKFVLSEKQAQAILDMRLARLTSLEVYKLEEEVKRLRELIKKLNEIIASKVKQFAIVKDELLQIKRNFKEERKTKISKQEEVLKLATEEDLKPANQEMYILKSAENNFKAVSTRQYNFAQKTVNENNTTYDTHTLKLQIDSSKEVIAFTNFGNCFKVSVKDFGESRYRDKGIAEANIFKGLGSKETIVAIFDSEETKENKGNLLFFTKFGMVKKTAFTEYALLKKYFQAMKLKDNDEIIKIEKEQEKYTVVFVTKSGFVLNAESNDIPLQGRISGGVKGINLATNDYCVGIDVAQDKGEVLALTNKGFAKRVSLSNIDKMVRYRKGLKFFNFSKDNGENLIYATVVKEPAMFGALESDKNVYFKSTDLVSIESRIGKGKAFEKFKKGTTFIKAYKIDN